jgi:superfamily I DNA and/or RNA helicase
MYRFAGDYPLSWNLFDIAKKIFNQEDSPSNNRATQDGKSPSSQSPRRTETKAASPRASPSVRPSDKIPTEKASTNPLSSTAARTNQSVPEASKIASNPSNQAIGNFFIDFTKNADDNVDPKGKTYWGLRRQLVALRRKYPDALFPGVGDQDILGAFQEGLFPSGVPQTYLISNISLREGQPNLTVRPSIIGPRLEKLLPPGVTLAIRGRLWDNQKDPNNPVFWAQSIIDLSQSPPRPFEQAITAFVIGQPQPIYPGNKRERNLLTSEFIGSLQSISLQTRERLVDWRNYLDWRERLIKANRLGLRFTDAEFLSLGQFRFLVIAESSESFEKLRRIFRNNDLRAYGLQCSKSPWIFDYNDDFRDRVVELGDFVRFEEADLSPNLSLEGIPWDSPFFAHVYFRLSDDQQNEFDSLTSYGSTEDVSRHFQGLLPTDGFLALSSVGDMALVQRQKKELDLLQEQSGYAPFLSSYLFEIGKANIANAPKDIPEDEWSRSDLNDDQKSAIMKMVNAPDLALIQGPPGTGKTTMIAEASWQFVRNNKKVLLVSQANMAVDNALERLAKTPAIRAIRLGKKGDRENPFSKDRALATYYSSIAELCRTQTINVWDSADRQLRVLNQWLTTSDLISEDIKRHQQQIASLDTEIASSQNELQLENARVVKAREVALQRDSASAFENVIDQKGPAPGVVPNPILETFFNSVVTPLQALVAVGIRANKVWLSFDYGSPAEKSAYATEIMRFWGDLCEALPQIKGDAERLTASESDLVISPGDAVELSDLERRLKKSVEALADDGSLLTEVQSLQKKIREIKRRGSGLDRSLYEQIFNAMDGDVPASRLFTDPLSSRDEVVAALNRFTNIFTEVNLRVTDGLELTRKQIRTYLESVALEEPDQALLRRLDGQIRDSNARRSEASKQLQVKVARLSQLITERTSEDGIPGEWVSEQYPALRKLVSEYSESISTKAIETSQIRQDWEPLLRDWVKDLIQQETCTSDQSNFMDIYLSSCNVVGVTCTENRRTLEDAGHSRFDVVIVDEVSKATPPEIIMPMMLGRTAILVGDHRQLPPLFKETEGSWEEALAEQEESPDPDGEEDAGSELTAENFERFRQMVTSSLFKEHFENAPQELKSFLFTQYRMHPQIMQVVNQFYENRLICGLSDPDGKLSGSDPRGHRLHGMTLLGSQKSPYLTPEQHAIWIDSTFDPLRNKHFERRDGHSSKANDLEAAVIAKTLQDIEQSCRDQGYGKGGKSPKSVGVVTFYGRQIKVIREAVKRARQIMGSDFTAIRIDINTVDRYQGQERPIIIVSMVRNPPWKLSARANTAQFERINVAFSRAQELLVVVGAKDVFCSYPVQLPYLDKPGSSRVEVYRYIIEEIQRNGGLFQSEQILSQDEFIKLVPNQDTRGQRR